MATHTIKTVQKIPASLKETWDFFSSPVNLDTITPGNMAFRTITKFGNEKIYPGQIIEYKVSPIFRIPLYWMTEIREVKEEKFFIDEQRKGPYAIWHHEHYFKEIEGGVEMIDIVQYKNPFGFIGVIANAIFVKRQLRKIFQFRYQKIEEIFGKWPNQSSNIMIK